MEPELSRIESTPEELAELKQIEDLFWIAKIWGYDPTGHRAFEMTSHKPPLGIEAQEYTDVVFRNFYRAGQDLPLFFASDVKSKFEQQSKLSERTQDALSQLVAKYFLTHPVASARVRLGTFASNIGHDNVSATHHGIKQGVAQLLDIADGNWSNVLARRDRTLELFETVKPRDEPISREEGSGRFKEWIFWISVGPAGAGSSYYPVGEPTHTTSTGNYNEDETLIDSDEDWDKIWDNWKSDTSPREEDLIPFARYVASLRRVDMEIILG